MYMLVPRFAYIIFFIAIWCWCPFVMLVFMKVWMGLAFIHWEGSSFWDNQLLFILCDFCWWLSYL